GVGEIQALRGLVGHDALFHLGDRQPLAGRPALMQAIVAVCVEYAVLTEHTNLMVAGEHDAALAVLEVGNLADKSLSHLKHPSTSLQHLSVARRGWAGQARR